MAEVPGKHFIGNLIASRTLLYQMVRRDFRQRFVGSAAGWLWGLIHPLVLLASWSFVFQFCLGQEMPTDAVTNNYSVVLFGGFLPWLLFQQTVTRYASSLVEQENLITKTVIYCEILAISLHLSALISQRMALSMALAAVALWAGRSSPLAWLLPFYMLLLGMFAVRNTSAVTSPQVYIRDTEPILTVVLTLR